MSPAKDLAETVELARQMPTWTLALLLGALLTGGGSIGGLIASGPSRAEFDEASSAVKALDARMDKFQLDMANIRNDAALQAKDIAVIAQRMGEMTTTLTEMGREQQRYQNDVRDKLAGFAQNGVRVFSTEVQP